MLQIRKFINFQYKNPSQREIKALFTELPKQIVAMLIQICYPNVTYLYQSSYIFVWEIFSHMAVQCCALLNKIICLQTIETTYT